VPTAGPLLFFDLETTGLSGGAGTLAFLVGCGFFDAEGFHTRQFFLSGYEAERELLDALTALAGRFNGLVTFNGRTFDVPLIETRYLFHRLESPFADMPHFDMLHPARKLWRRRDVARPSHRERWSDGRPGDRASCALGALEEAILGVERFGDVPGAEIPSRYFNYLRTGDLAPLAAVFEHNRLDLLSLAALTAIAARMAGEGPAGAPSPHEALAMGQIYVRLGRWDEADTCFARAAGLGEAPWDARSVDRDLRADALRHLALERRRRHRHEEAAEAWRQLLDAGADPGFAQEARRALAIHHEHRARDLEAARRHAERALASEQDPVEAEALRHRIARLDRKLGRR
jgi:tetratricopeptide (TPR) repeat protein